MALGFGCGRISVFAAEAKAKVGFGFRASADSPPSGRPRILEGLADREKQSVYQFENTPSSILVTVHAYEPTRKGRVSKQQHQHCGAHRPPHHHFVLRREVCPFGFYEQHDPHQYEPRNKR
jgi:hypothetical protein